LEELGGLGIIAQPHMCSTPPVAVQERHGRQEKSAQEAAQHAIERTLLTADPSWVIARLDAHATDTRVTGWTYDSHSHTQM